MDLRRGHQAGRLQRAASCGKPVTCLHFCLSLLLIAALVSGCSRQAAAQAGLTASQTADGQSDSVETETRWGEENYQAEVAALRYEALTDDEGEGVVYHEISDLEYTISHTDSPILLAVYDTGLSSASTVIPYMEQQAENWGDQVLVILAQKDSQDSFLQQFSVEEYPAFFVVRESQIKLRFYGLDSSSRAQLNDTLTELLAADT
ncbi:hypothetical protein HCH52_05290 [Oscillospiraceae bacterium HV4-5-C5C]|nr:hypothetical protein [Oscillospiraceae bacterium HV4-5-C5C]